MADHAGGDDGRRGPARVRGDRPGLPRRPGAGRALPRTGDRGELRVVAPHGRGAPVPRRLRRRAGRRPPAEAARIGFHFAEGHPGVVRAGPPADLRRRPREGRDELLRRQSGGRGGGAVGEPPQLDPQQLPPERAGPRRAEEDDRGVGPWSSRRWGRGPTGSTSPTRSVPSRAIMGPGPFVHCAAAADGTSTGARFCRYEESGQIDVGAWKRLHLAAFLEGQRLADRSSG